MNNHAEGTDHYFVNQPKSEERFGLVRTTICGKNFEFLTASSVFSKKRVDLGTRLLIESMLLPKEGFVLDIGCGYGAVGIVASALNKKLRVIMTDVNMRAVRLARQNINSIGITNAIVRHGHLYEPVESMKFNCVLSNPPISAGMDTVKAIIKGSKNVMAQDATFQMVIRSKIGSKAMPSLFCETFGNFQILSRGSGFRVLMGKNSNT